jgi:energy-coupling factor transporter ATP-binding protein EcfA2
MVRLTRLKIDRFRNVKPGTDLHFGPTFNALLGKNATGKSTLLDLVAAITNDDLSAYAEEDAGFDLTWWLEKGNDEVEMKVERAPAKAPALPDDVGDEKVFDDFWTMTLRTAGIDTGRMEVTGTHGLWQPRGEAEERFDVRTGLATDRVGLRTLLAVSQKHSRKTTPAIVRIRAAYPMFTGPGRVGRFDEAIDALDALTRSFFTLSCEGNVVSGGADDPWLPMVLLSPTEGRFPEAFVFSFDKLGPLLPIPGLLGFTSAELRLRLVERLHDPGKETYRFHGFNCLFQRADGTQISHELLSFGQKRLFSFLWYLAVREQLPVVADELFNGLHHEWIEVCLDRLYDRQSFLATQHPYLLDHIPIESANAVRTTFIRCTLERSPDGREQMVWRNFDADEAERFFVAYQTGISQVSEVLRMEGLW